MQLETVAGVAFFPLNCFNATCPYIRVQQMPISCVLLRTKLPIAFSCFWINLISVLASTCCSLGVIPQQWALLTRPVREDTPPAHKCAPLDQLSLRVEQNDEGTVAIDKENGCKHHFPRTVHCFTISHGRQSITGTAQGQPKPTIQDF